ncbi:MAG TPA: caspase family protein [Candidatus Cloacimonadota bacterium]|nr:caspase family protein [Candidatus Cloacimonadota bacterium]
MKKPVLLVLLVLLLVPVFAARKALIIGNAAYQSKTLKNPVNDAIDLEAALKDLGFDTTLLKNADYVTMKRGIQKFTDGLNYNDEAIFYFSGHGVQISDINYLIPIGDMTLKDKVDYDAYTIQATWALGKLANAKVSIMILDACRDNPTLTKTMSLKKGLAKMEPETGSQYVIYATEKDTEAFDGEDRNSPFASSLLRNIKSPVAVGDELLRLIRNDVRAATNNQQIPTSYGFLDEPYYLMPPAAQTPERKVQTAQESLPAIPAPPEPQIETVWLYGILEVETNQPGDLYLNGVKRQSLTTGQGSQIRTVTGDYTVELRTAIGNQSRQVSVQKDQTLSLAFRFEKQEQPTLSPQAEAIQTPKPDPQAQPKDIATSPKEEPQAAEPSTLAQLKLPQSNNPVPKVKDAPAIDDYQPQAGAEVQRKVASRIRFGMKADGGLDYRPNYPSWDADYPFVSKEGTYLVNSDMYALWQYRQVWLKLGLTFNHGDYYEDAYLVPDISARIPLGIVDLHFGVDKPFKFEDLRYDVRLEKSLRLGSTRFRVQADLSVLPDSNDDKSIHGRYEDILKRYYYGPLLYDYGFMGLSSFKYENRQMFGIELGNDAGLENLYHLNEASLVAMPLSKAETGAYQIAFFWSQTMFDFSNSEPTSLIDELYRKEKIARLDIAWKPQGKIETNISASIMNGEQEWEPGSITHIDDFVEYRARYNLVYSFNKLHKAVFNGILGLHYSQMISRGEYHSLPSTTVGGSISGLISYMALPGMKLHALLGLGLGYDKNKYDYVDDDYTDGIVLMPVLAIGINMNYEKLFFKK